jgi:hypothetical protein
MNNRFKPLTMLSNQKSNLLRLLTLICLLIFTISSFGQKKNIIKNILDEDGDTFTGSVKISIKKPTDNESKDSEIKINDILESESTIHVKDPYITLVLESYNGTIVEIPGKTILDIKITNENEKYQLLKSESSNYVIVNKLKEYVGSVLATGTKVRLQALTSGTIFSLGLADDELEIALIDGKLNLNHLIKREIKDNIVIDNDSIRSIFIRQNSQLTVKDGTYPDPNNDFNSQPILTGDKEIKKFLRKPFIDQRRILISMGEFSKMAVKELENEVSIDKALLSFEKAIENGEITIDFVIQSALLFADSYLYNDNIEKSKAWLEVGIHYNKIFFDTKQEILENSLNNDDSEISEIDKAIINALRYEMLTANEFSAWGYDIKLKLNSCLENPSENPTKYRSNAKDLIKKIEGNN